MADEKPKKTRTTTRAPRKRAAGQPVNEAAPIATAGNENNARNVETPVLAIEQTSEINGASTDEVDEIRRQAYALYLSRGAGDGNDLSDWLEAERLVRRRRGAADSAEPDRR